MAKGRTRSSHPTATACAEYSFRQRFRVPPEPAFRWCVEYEPYDARHSGGHGSRKVTWIGPRTVLLDDVFPGPGGKRVRKVKVVQVYPEDRSWVSTHIVGPNRHSQFRYRIVPDGKHGSALVFEGRDLRWQGRPLTPAAERNLSERLRKEDAELWVWLASLMEQDLLGR
ncbi:MAG TPA: hypothetical protein VEG42_03820 [Thermoplasmata archaeon]|nr:hypothetical protein [Thermoplasmata archaeon]